MALAQTRRLGQPFMGLLAAKTTPPACPPFFRFSVGMGIGAPALRAPEAQEHTGINPNLEVAGNINPAVLLIPVCGRHHRLLLC